MFRASLSTEQLGKLRGTGALERGMDVQLCKSLFLSC